MMTPKDHNKVLGIMHLVYGGFNLLSLVIMAIFFIFFAGILASAPSPDGDFPIIFFFAIMAVATIVTLLLALPSLVAGYGMLKRKSWARTAGIVSSICSSLGFPFGTALCVYSLWFLFGEEGRTFYGREAIGAGRYGSLREGQPYISSTFGQDARERDYVPPSQPPDWRS